MQKHAPPRSGANNTYRRTLWAINTKLMKFKLLIFIFCPILSYGQSVNALKDYLDTLYCGFPVFENEMTIQKYIQRDTDFNPEINIYDSLKVDYSKTLEPRTSLQSKPLNERIDYYYTYGWQTINGIIEQSRIISLALYYGDTLSLDCKKQYEIIQSRLNKLTPRNRTYEILEGKSQIGIGAEYYLHRRDKYPLITISLTTSAKSNTYNRIHVDFHKIIKK